MKRIFVLFAVIVSLFLVSCADASAVTKDEAKSFALKHAGIKTEDATFTKVKLDTDDGNKVYEIEFRTKDNKEYDYEIDAKTGGVISFDEDIENHTPVSNDKNANATSSDIELITPERAKEIAIKKVSGSSVSDIKEFELDRDDGKKVYEGKIIYDNMEYEFDIDAKTGEIIKWESESVFD